MRTPKHLKKVRVVMHLHVRREIRIGALLNEITDAVETWGGQRRPDDPLFYGIAVQKLKGVSYLENLETAPIETREIEPWEGEDPRYD